MNLVQKDLEEVDVQNLQLAAVLAHNLQEIAAKGLNANQLGPGQRRALPDAPDGRRQDLIETANAQVCAEVW